MCVLRAHDRDVVHGVGMAGSGERGLLYGGSAAGARGSGIPQKNLAGIGSADDEVGVERGEFGRQDVRG